MSVIIPVYNGSETLGPLLEEIHADFAGTQFEIVLVNDGSADASEAVCNGLVERYPGTVCFVNLARNFGEHNAVLAGLKYASGQYVAMLDDDGQNLPREVLRMLKYATARNLDVVYGRYRDRKHPPLRIIGSWFNDQVANFVLNKPRDIYLSSFKVVSRFVVDELLKFSGPFPYLDGLIFRVTRNIGQIDVAHRPRQAGRSGYTPAKLVGLWLNMFFGFSIVPLRLSLVVGVAAAALSLLMLGGIVVDKIWINPGVPVGIPTVLACVVFFAGVQLALLGTVGEYVGRLFLQQSGMPPYVVRYAKRKEAPAQPPVAEGQNGRGFPPELCELKTAP